MKELKPGTTSTNATTGKTDITYDFVLYNFEETLRQEGIPYKEISGNIKLKIKGRGESPDTYTENVLTDEYGNQSMMAIDDATGTWIDVTFGDEDKKKITAIDESITEITNTTPVYMFADFIKPEFTYEYTNTTIGDGNHGDTKIVTVVFDVTDKYFNRTELETDTNAELIKVLVDGKLPGDTNGDGTIGDGETLAITKELAQTGKFVLNKETNVVTTQATDYIINESTERKVGERYQLVIKNLEQKDENGYSTGFDFSGVVTLGFDSGIIEDLSGNENNDTTITIGIDDPTTGDGHDSAVNADVVDPTWQLGDISLTNGTIKLKAIDKFFKKTTITTDKITVYVNGVPSETVVKDITTIQPTEIKDTVQGNTNATVGYEYTLQLSNLIPEGGGYTTFEPKNKADLNQTVPFKYRSENGGRISIKIEQGTIEDQSGNLSEERTFDIGMIDATKPEVYEVQKIQDTTANTETIIFNVIDRNYDPTDLITLDVDKDGDGTLEAEEIEITVWVDGVKVDTIDKSNLTYKPITLDIDGETDKVLGHQYTLVLEDIAETVKQTGKDYLEWSGTLEIRIAENAAKDKNGNTLNPDTTTIRDFVDYIKPQIEKVAVTTPVNETDKTYTISFKTIDKYIDITNMITTGEIQIYVDGELVTAVAKPTTEADKEANKDKIWMELTNIPITATMNKTVDGTIVNGNHTIGHTYSLVLSNFEQSVKQSGKSFIEWSGTVQLKIVGNAVTDLGPRGDGVTPNGNVETPIAGEYVDLIKPVIERVSSTKDATAKTETIVFNVYDKYLDTNDLLLDTEITVLVDGEVPGDTNGNGVIDGTETSAITKSLTKEQDFTATVNGAPGHVVGQQYKLVLSGFEQSTRNSKEYKDWSGTVQLKFAENAVTDFGPNGDNVNPNGNKETTIDGDFVDFIKPDLKYTHKESDIDNTGDNETGKKYTMTFDVTDKYYTSGELQLSDLTILMQNGQYEPELDENGNPKLDENGKVIPKQDANGNKIPIVYDLKQLADNGEIGITFTPVAKMAENVKVTNATTGVVETVASHQIGHTYTLKITGLEQLEIKEGLTTLDYSGVITVDIAKDIISDRSDNKNDETTITTGVGISSGVQSGTDREIDVVDPKWNKVSSSAYAIDPANTSSSTATITFRGTDTYYVEDSEISKDIIKVFVNGSEVTTGITKDLTATKLTEERVVDGATEIVQYGVEYTLTITGFAQDANQVKIQIPKGAMIDQNDNDSELKEFIIYNVLRLATNETGETSAFLGSTDSEIKRMNIENVTFLSSTKTAPETGWWDVSAAGDNSIIAWATQTTTQQTNGTYTVYIASDSEIFGNQNSNYLFMRIGRGDNSTATEAITNINLLNVSSVTSMRGMFNRTGYTAMTSLNLGDNFDTRNVTDMAEMFFTTGSQSMTTFDLGDKFDTSKVEDMSTMFYGFGNVKLTSLDLSSGTTASNTKQFNTSSVKNMAEMFLFCGQNEMQTINLGNNFNTENVVDMQEMFRYCGQGKMTELNLGTKFDTKNVTNMNSMFENCGTNEMTTLNLGSKFDTSNVTDMADMFYYTGQYKMSKLDLGNLFNTSNVTNMSRMFYRTGQALMTELDLGDKFNTAKVTDMYRMFYYCGASKMTGLDLGDKFYTTSATNMNGMFLYTGNTAMTTLDLGPAFTRIPEGTVSMTIDGTTSEVNANTDFITNTGKSGCIIYAPESIYSSQNAFKLNSTDKTTTIEYTRGTIKPTYKPEWEKVSSTLDLTNQTLTVTLKGSAYESLQNIDSNVSINYASDVTSTLQVNDIQVFIDGVNVTSETRPEKVLGAADETTNATSGKKEITHTFTLSNLEEAVRRAGIPYKEWSGNISLKIAGRGQATSTYYNAENAILRDEYGNQNMMETDEGQTVGTWIDIKIDDEDKNKITAIDESITEITNTTPVYMFSDFIKPEFTYEYANTTIGDGDHGDTKIVTVVFDVTDKYFKSTDLATDTNADLIKVLVDGELPGDTNGDGTIGDGETLAITKALSRTAIFVRNKSTNVITTQSVDYTIDESTEQKVGERYQLIIRNLEQHDAEGYSTGFDFSGIVTLGFDSGIIEDLSGNENYGTTITIGKDDPTTGDGHDSGTIVDVVDPVWQIDETELETTGIIKLRAKDKFFETSTLDEDDITIYINGVASTEITKTLTGPTEIENGVEYTLELGNVTLTEGSYTTFEPKNKDELNQTVPFKYRAENGGAVKLGIAADTIEDQYGNKSLYREFNVGVMDDTRPEVYEVQKIQDPTNKTETIIFNVTDRNYDETDLITLNTDLDGDGEVDPEISVWIDGIQVDDSIIKELTYKPIKLDIDGETGKVVGHQYTLVVSELVEKHVEFIATGRTYKELSGTIEIKIESSAAKDINANTLNPDTTTISDFVDFIKPEVTYEYKESSQATPGDINYQGKTFTMVIDILDKYYKESTLTIDDLTILIDRETIDWTKVDKDLTITDVKETFNKTVSEDVNGNGILDSGEDINGNNELDTAIIVNGEHVIGQRYTLVISKLEQLEIASGAQYADYSGVITVQIPDTKVTDTKNNANSGTTVTSGIKIVADVEATDQEELVVDVVDPIWQKVSSSASAIDPDNPTSSTATITIRGTDKYYQESILTQENIKTYIKVYANTGNTPGSTTTTDVTESVNITVSEATPVYKTGTTDQQVGDEYTLTITGFEQNVNQIKIEVQPGAMTDQSGNTNKDTEMIVYNVLRAELNDEIRTDTVFLSAENSALQRQNIENVTFLSSTETAPDTGWWDVSATGDDSIIAWATQTAEQATNGVYTVYIASDSEIFGNQNSQGLFAYIGYGEYNENTYTATEAITNLHLLNVSSVTSMKKMFMACGYSSMTALNLGDFDTSNVTSMENMFYKCGYTAMTTFNLGTKFNTSKVTDMSNMFYKLGYTAMTELKLEKETGETNIFNTSNVTDMESMFNMCGYTAMTDLYLGKNFDTSSVTNMKMMFMSCGNTALTSLDLTSGMDNTNTTQFNTSNVTDMEAMFYSCGRNQMTSFNLGYNFDTSKVKDMQYMFYYTGHDKLTELDLGNKFATSNVENMQGMFYRTGVSKMEKLDLGDKFNTAKVTNMYKMFYHCGENSLTSLDLGDKFYTTSATNMNGMFLYTGNTAMTTLDLGPAFTRIPEGTVSVTVDGTTSEVNANAEFVSNTGKSGCIIYASEQIYNDMNNFKLNTDSETVIEYTQGTINPIYKPEWSKVSSTLDTSTGIMTVVVKGTANKTVTNGTYTGTYVSDVVSTLATGNVTVYVDDELADDVTAEVSAVTESTNATTNATEVQHTITLNLEKTLRKSGKNFLEWSGNIALQFAKGSLRDKNGSYLTTDGEGNSIPVVNVFTDASGNYIGNSNLAEIDTGTTTNGEGNTVLVMENIVVEDENSPLTENTETPLTEANMFSDTIEPEFTYEYYNIEGDTGANTTIDLINNTVTVVFDVTDKYFEQAVLSKDDITVKVNEDVNADTAIEKQLNKTGIFVMNKQTKEITLQATDYTIDATTEQITGERYQLVITGLESANGVGYSGPMSLVFPAGQTEVDENGDTVLVKGMIDKSGNLNEDTTITIGIDQPSNHPEHGTGVVVDVVNPIWVGLRDVNSIERADTDLDDIDDDTVSIKILGIEKYYKTNTLSTDDITVYIDKDGNGTIEDTEILSLDPNTDMALEAIPTAELVTLAGDTELANYDDVRVGYTLKLTGFGDYSGMTKIKIDDGTIEDQSGNKNINTNPIFAGNTIWVETNEPLESTDANYPRYDAFREDIVDFIDPVINYTYSSVMVDTDGDGTADTEISANPDIDYTQKEVTVKFTVTDKYLLGSDLIKTDAEGNLTTLPKNMSIIVGGTTVYDSSLETQTTQVTTSIELDSTDFSDGVAEYTLVVSNLQQNPNTGFDFSGPMQLSFTEGAIDDTSGNKNTATVISLQTHVDPDIVDVVDPIISKTENGLSILNTSNVIDRENKSVTVYIQGTDKYLSSGPLLAENIKVRIEEHDGDVIEDASATNLKLTKADGTVITDQDVLREQYPDGLRVTKTIVSTQLTSSETIKFEILLSNFGNVDEDGVFNGIYEGKVTLVIPENAVLDTSGNGNIDTSVLIGNSSDTTAFKDSIVEFEKPTWNYAISSITRDRNDVVNDDTDYVTIKIIGHDNYYNLTTLTKDLINVLIDGTENEDVVKDLQQITDTTELTNLATQAGLANKIAGRTITDVAVGYTLTLKGFGLNEEAVEIQIQPNTIRDTSGNGNKLTPIDVGNTEWVEDNEALESTDTNYPAFDAFRNNIVDYIKPVITLESAEIDRNTNNGTVTITFDATDRNYTTLDKLPTNVIGIEDIQIFVDTNSNEREVTDTITKNLTRETEAITKTVNGKEVTGYRYTLTLSGFDKGKLDDDIFKSHSGVIKLVIAGGQVADTSGNKNNETVLIANEFQDGENSTGIADFVKPIIEEQDKYVNWEEHYALVALRVTDRFIDTDTQLQLVDAEGNSLIKFYEETADGDIIDITEQLKDNLSITRTDALLDDDGNTVGYDFIIRIDNFEEEFRMKINIPAGQVGDTSENKNDATDIWVELDNRKPVWNYVSTDSTTFESNGTISFTVKGEDKFLNLTSSNLDVADIKVLKDGVDITNADNITVNYLGTNTAEEADEDIYKKYKIDVTGLTEMGTYSLVFAEDTLVDTFGNTSAATTISFSNSVIASNTDNYVNVTYHVTPDMEIVHKSFVHELMSVNTTGTNFENSTYRPSTLGEIFNNGENPLFAEPMYVPSVDGYTVEDVYSPKSFAGWAVCDEDGNVADDATIYGLYDEIPNTVTHLKAVWQDATLVFVSETNGNNSNNGQLPTTPVKDLATAYAKLNASGTAENNIIVIVDSVEYDSESTLTGNATITSVYAGVDYRSQGAELKISSNMIVDGSITFDNIKLYVTDSTVSDGEDYLGNGTYQNMLISNYSGDIIIGRGVTTPTANYTFGAIVGGNFKTETTSGTLGTHTIRIEAGKYNNIIAGSTLSSSTTTTKSITHEVVIGNMRDAAVSRNDKLTITGYVAIGENEQKCYPNGATGSTAAQTLDYSNVTVYSGTITGVNKFTKADENAAIYLRTINGQTDGLMNFEIFGGVVQGDIYAGSRVATSTEGTVFNTMKFYGGQVTGNVFGQGANNIFTGSSDITLQGNFTMTGNIYGGSNVTSTDIPANTGTGNSTITINSGSVTVTGNIYGGGRVSDELFSDGVIRYVTGTTNIKLNLGTVSNIYGSGYNCGNLNATNITIENGLITGNVVGGAYKNQSRTTINVTILGGTINGNIYGGNENIESQLSGDAFYQNVNIIIGDTDATKAPTINGLIFGSGKYDKATKVTIDLIECANVTSVFAGSDAKTVTSEAVINLNGMTVNEIYGGGRSTGTDSGNISVSSAKINLQSGTVTDVYGGGYESNVVEARINLEGSATATNIYGGSNVAGTTSVSRVTLTSGQITNVFGGGNKTAVTTANVTLNGTVEVDTIHGGSKDAGVTGKTNVTLTAGTVNEVFGGGLDVGVTTANIIHQGATVGTIYGGNNSITGVGGETETANIEIINSTVGNVYGGNKNAGTTRYTKIDIHGTSTITGNVFGGGYKSAIGNETDKGTTTINIAGGTINGDINGGSEESIVYGNTTINIGPDATSGLTTADIDIIGIIYGAGSTLTKDQVTVVGNTNITIDKNNTYKLDYFTSDDKEKSIYGSGKGGAKYSNGTTIDNSTIHIKDLGSSEIPYLLKSIENTGDLYIGNSVIELSGALEDTTNKEIGNYYTLNTITNALTIYSNTTLYTQRGFNKVGGFYSYETKNSGRAEVTISEGVATISTDNRIYTLEGINLIFAKEEVTLANKSTLARDKWGEVTGMTYFGLYKNTSTGKVYDLDLFRAGTYVEGQYNSYHNVDIDGFYTTIENEEGTQTAQIIDTVNYTNYCDWIINAPTINYDVDLVASTYGHHSVAELLLDYKYASDYEYVAETVYTVNTVSSNALKPGIQIVNSDEISTISEDANNKFALTMETMPSGWQKQALTNIYSASNGLFDGDSVYTSDTSATPGTIKFKLYNSINITEQKDLGMITVILTGQQPLNGSGTEAYTFNVVIGIDLQTVLDDLKEQYTPSFTNKLETELSYTTDSRVDLSYILYNNMETTPYAIDDYRVISTTVQLPAKTKLTMRDYGQGDSLNKVYYYQVASDTDYDSTETVDGITRYIYKLSKFAEMGSSNNYYADSTEYYHSTEKYVFEKYDISIDFIDSGIGEKLAQETYLELRNLTGDVKYDNGDTTIKYNLRVGQNAEATETIDTELTSYSVVESLEIPIDISASILEQPGIMDTKYYDQIAGIAVQIVGENNIRIKAPELQNFKLTNTETGEVYDADSNGVIRMPLIEGLGSKSGSYTLSITQANVTPGLYTAQVILYTADDGKYYGATPEIAPLEFNITFISRLAGLLGVEAKDGNEATRIINQSTKLNLVDGSQLSNAIDMVIGVNNPTNETNIRVELYKRNPTYTSLTDETTYTGTTYTLVDIKDYLQGTWETPETYGLTSATGSKEYIVSTKKTYVTPVEIETLAFQKAVVDGIATGEYKLVFKAYSDDTLLQTFSKTFIVTP